MAPLAGLDYRTCSIRELRRFIRNRSHTKDEPPTKNKLQRRVDEATLLSTLQQLDDDWRFNFFGLPAELRDMIYSELLVLDQQSLKCWPQILRACKQINKAATKMFYLHNDLPIGVRTLRSRHGCGIFLGADQSRWGKIDHETRFDSNEVRLGNAMWEWPSIQLLRATKLHLTIVLYQPDALRMDKGCLTLNHLLYALASLLGYAKKIQKIHINVEFAKDPDAMFRETETQGMFFYPLIRLMTDDRTVTFEGITPAVQNILPAHKNAASIQLRRPIQTMQQIVRSGTHIERYMRRINQDNSKLKLFALGTSRLELHLNIDRWIDAAADKSMCDDITALQLYQEEVDEAVDLLERQVFAAELQEAKGRADTDVTGAN